MVTGQERAGLPRKIALFSVLIDLRQPPEAKVRGPKIDGMNRTSVCSVITYEIRTIIYGLSFEYLSY